MRAVLVGAALLALAGCSGPYQVTSETPTERGVCYDPILYSRQQVAEEATRHCAARGLTPRIAIQGRCGFGGVNNEVVYECVSTPRPS